MEDEPKDRRSHLFTVRVWREELGDDQFEWRGKVQQVDTGEAFYFREWRGVIAYLKIWLQ
jgi:hypothetical protein